MMIADIPTVLTVVSTLGLCYFIYCLSLVARNRSAAITSGLDWYYFPLADSKTWYILIPTPPILWLISLLPPNIQGYVYSSSYATRWKARYTGLHAKVGDTCLMVSSNSLSLYIADAGAACEVFAHRTKFVKPSWNYDHLKMFGNNVVACDEHDWRHHRRFTGPPFNEKNNALVWKETLQQAGDMLATWTIKKSSGEGGYVPVKQQGSTLLDTSRMDFRRLALHVIAAAGFGVSLPFSQTAEPVKSGRDNSLFSGALPPAGYSRTFGAAMEYIATNMVTVVALKQMLPTYLLTSGPFATLRAPLEVVRDIENYVAALIALARKDTDASRFERSGNLLSSIVLGGEKVSDRDIVGNVFIFSIAGHETTASTLNFALAMLALHPAQQSWLHSKLDVELAGLPQDPALWDYAEVYERLVSLRCLMFETLRLFPPLPGIAKWAEESYTLTTSDGTTHTLPAKLWITVNATGLHYNPKYWGLTASSFDPSRWDAANADSFLSTIQQSQKNADQQFNGLHVPVPGSWVPFSDGPRACLGKKFAVVEFVAAMATVLRGCKVEIAHKDGENIEQARERVWAAVNRASGYTALVMGEEVGLVVNKRL